MINFEFIGVSFLCPLSLTHNTLMHRTILDSFNNDFQLIQSTLQASRQLRLNSYFALSLDSQNLVHALLTEISPQKIKMIFFLPMAFEGISKALSWLSLKSPH